MVSRKEALEQDKKTGFSYSFVREPNCYSEYCTYYGVFGKSSNFCYSQHDTEDEAKEESDLMNELYVQKPNKPQE